MKDLYFKEDNSSCNEITTGKASNSQVESEPEPSLLLTRSISTPNFASATTTMGKTPNRIPQFMRNTFVEGLRTSLSSTNSSSINLSSSKLSDIESNENSYVGNYAQAPIIRGRSIASSKDWQMTFESNIKHSVEFRSLFFQTLQECFEHTMSRKLLYKVQKRKNIGDWREKSMI